LSIWGIPQILWVTSGAGEGDTPLNAFDNALLAAGIGHLNLVKVSSVIPEGAELVEDQPKIAPGALVPAVFTSCRSSIPGQLISSCVGLGFSAGGHGMIMEHSQAAPAEETEVVVQRMVEEAFLRRGLQLERIVIRSIGHKVQRVGCTTAAVLLWWR
jgi:arginine decarboxylase